MHEIVPVLKSLSREVRAGRPAALCAIVKTRGSTPQGPGACMLVRSDMQTEGTLGGGCVEVEVLRRAFTFLQQGRSAKMDFVLDHDFGWDDGLICGGRMDVAMVPVLNPKDLAPFESAAADLEAHRTTQVPFRVEEEGNPVEYRLNIRPSPRLIIAGGGHVGLALAQLCGDLDFDITVIDDREKFSNPDRFGPGVECLVGSIDETLRAQRLDPSAYVVIVTRGHQHDERALSAVVQSDARYIGLIGSRRKIKLIRKDLLAEGVSEEQLDRVHAPIGLPIKAVTVKEIAVSIASQLVQVRRADDKDLVEGPIPVPNEASA